MSVSVAVVEPVGGHGGMNYYDFALCKSIVHAGGKATLFTCDKTIVHGTEGFPVMLTYRGIFGQSHGWIRGLRFFWEVYDPCPGPDYVDIKSRIFTSFMSEFWSCSTSSWRV